LSRRSRRRRSPTVGVGAKAGAVEAAIVVAVVIDRAEHTSLKVPSQDMDLEGLILHVPLQRIIRCSDPEMNDHLLKPIESFVRS
jgi:hypothetical protein